MTGGICHADLGPAAAPPPPDPALCPVGEDFGGPRAQFIWPSPEAYTSGTGALHLVLPSGGFELNSPMPALDAALEVFNQLLPAVRTTRARARTHTHT